MAKHSVELSRVAIQFAKGSRLACVPSGESINCLYVCPVTRLARNLTKHVTRWFNAWVLGQCFNGKPVYLAIIKINTLNKKLSKFCLDVMCSNALSIFFFVFIRSVEHYLWKKQLNIRNHTRNCGNKDSHDANSPFCHSQTEILFCLR